MSAETPVARIVQKAPGAAYGLDVAEATFRALGLDAGVERNVDEGRSPDAGAGRARPRPARRDRRADAELPRSSLRHFDLAGSVTEAVRRARAAAPDLGLEVECRSEARCPRRSPPAPPGCCSTTWPPPRVRALVERVGGRAERGASGGVESCG